MNTIARNAPQKTNWESNNCGL